MGSVFVGYENCPDQGSDLPEQCLTIELLNTIYDLIDEVTAIVNIHRTAAGEATFPDITRVTGGCAAVEVFDNIITYLTSLADSGRLPKRVREAGGGDFPDPSTPADVADWENCDGYWDSYAHAKGWRPSMRGSPVLHLSGTEHSVRVTT